MDTEQEIEELKKEVADLKQEVAKKEDKPDLRKKYIVWGVMVLFIAGFYIYYLATLRSFLSF
ncbi:hypothetical protein KGO95_03695 [Patescibacteria group bacterium]|nr:hypothetical protein [Patescibacteria group bacterium]